jgi:hypothetical protein
VGKRKITAWSGLSTKRFFSSLTMLLSASLSERMAENGPKTFKGFNFTRFWNWVRKVSVNNIVIVSEYTAPDEFTEVWSKQTVRANKQTITTRVEKLFVWNNDKNKFYK